jgi:hypothetical protein
MEEVGNPPFIRLDFYLGGGKGNRHIGINACFVILLGTAGTKFPHDDLFVDNAYYLPIIYDRNTIKLVVF